MEKFTLKDMLNFFGNRGYKITPRCFKKWATDGTYIYWITNPDECSHKPNSGIECHDLWRSPYMKKDTVIWTSINNLYVEPEDEIYVDNFTTPLNWKGGRGK